MDDYVPGSICQLISGKVESLSRKVKVTPTKSAGEITPGLNERRYVRFKLKNPDREQQSHYAKSPFPTKLKKKLKQPIETNFQLALSSEERLDTGGDKSTIKKKKNRNVTKNPDEGFNLEVTNGAQESTPEKGKSLKRKNEEEAAKKQTKKKKGKVKEQSQDTQQLDEDKTIEDESQLTNLSEKKISTRRKKKKLTKEQKEGNCRLTVFVGNIPVSCDHQKVKNKFKKFGDIESVRIRCVPVPDPSMPKKIAAIKKEFNPHRGSAVAFVKFKTEEGVSAALKANGMEWKDHRLRIDQAGESKLFKDDDRAVFIGQLPFDVEDDAVWDLFCNCGKILAVRLIRDKGTSMGKGFGYVNFESSSSVELALKLDGTTLSNRKISVQRISKKKSKKVFDSNARAPNKVVIKNKSWKQNPKKNVEDSTNSDFKGSEAQQKKKVKKRKPNKDELKKKKMSKILNFEGINSQRK